MYDIFIVEKNLTLRKHERKMFLYEIQRYIATFSNVYILANNYEVKCIATPLWDAEANKYNRNVNGGL